MRDTNNRASNMRGASVVSKNKGHEARSITRRRLHALYGLVVALLSACGGGNEPLSVHLASDPVPVPAPAASAPAPAPAPAITKTLLFAEPFNAFSSAAWSCEYSCPTVANGLSNFVLQTGVAPNNNGSWSKIRYRAQRFTSGSFKVRFALSNRPDRAVWWGVALWDDGLNGQFNEINFGYTANQSFTNTQLYFESAKRGVATSVKIDTGVNLYDGQYHEAELEYDADHVSFYFDGRLMHTITDKRFIPTDPMDFIIGPRLVTGSAPLTRDFTQHVDWAQIYSISR
jgi:beta-glucanase (GH16 family)